MRVALVTPTMKSGERGGAEALYTGLLCALRRSGCDADQIEVVIDESTFDAILDSYARCAALRLDDYDAVISTKAPTYMVRHPRHVSYLLHTIRVFYDMFEREFGAGTPDLLRQRAAIHDLDKQGLDPARIRGHFANGRTTFQRLYDIDPWWRRIRFEALHHPPSLNAYRAPGRGDYIFLPGRLHRWKRVDLAIDAFRHVKADIPLLIAGTGEDAAAFRERAAGDRRIQFLGSVSDERLIDLYAGALAVPFVPQFEDYGLITIEAFNSCKPVLTCTDSGETLAFVKDGVTGRVTAPDPRAIGDAIDWFASHPDEAAAMGRRGHDAVAHITWDRVVSTLMHAAGVASDASRTTTEVASGLSRTTTAVASGFSRTRTSLNVTVVDMQPIEPAVGGGRVRLLGLYHALGDDVRTTYVGSYDWPGEKYRRVRHSDTLEEITVPLSPAHFEAASALQRQVPGTSVIDIAFAEQGVLSPDYVNAVKTEMAHGDVVVFSHPWSYPLVRDALDRTKQLLVYDAQNVESVLRATLLGDSGVERKLARDVAAVERDLCRDADVILACSHEDRTLFSELYDIPIEKIAIAPNGTFVKRHQPATAERRREAKAALGLPVTPVALFLGSSYGPNIEAARFICRDVAPKLPHVTFAICGSAGDAVRDDVTTANVRLPGVLSDADKARYLAAADIALNPMFSGSGTNVKMFDFMAAALPVLTTAVGARGIAQGTEPAFRVSEPAAFASAIDELSRSPEIAASLAAAGRRLVEQAYSWERISGRLGTLLARRRARLHARAPRLSVVVATYERHDHLHRLLESLSKQTCRDFEVVIVDQSAQRWPGAGVDRGLDLVYVHSDVRGATKARNTGAFLASGEIIAFTDDDCVPDATWLENASRYFDDGAVVGVEGMITSDKLNDPDYRTVSNVGFEGVGFMTANLFLRRSTFCAIAGFDERFDNPHFREDTDLAWRALEHGAIPYGRDVRVFHPPHRRDIAREGHEERNAFFEKDALLAWKHPRRYRTLMAAEGHFVATAGFAGHVLRGARDFGVELDPDVEWLVKSRAVRELLETV
jgi:glycosyltransferase involved in cell wall biosynthesis/GT2 family glycosyltransferase